MAKEFLFHHFTEALGEVHDYLRDILCRDDVEVLDVGADIRCGEYFVEVKACREFNQDKHSNGGRRRGRFHFQHPVNADYVLFVLMKGNGIYEKRLIASEYVIGMMLKGGLRTVLNSSEIFS